MHSLSIRRASLLFTLTLLAASSCVEELHDGVDAPSSVPGSVMTKVINTPEDSEDGVLLLCLSDEAADAYASGERSLMFRIIQLIHIKTHDVNTFVLAACECQRCQSKNCK